MKAVVVYESLWGNTAAIARAIAEGIGSGTQALPTDQATAIVAGGVDLIVAGAPILAFSLPTEAIRNAQAANPGKSPIPADLSHPSMRAWLDVLPAGKGHSASFETRIWWSPGSSAKAIESRLVKLGYSPVAKPQRFLVKGSYGPLGPGELEKAQRWGAELARLMF
jgi:hypothetical protein